MGLKDSIVTNIINIFEGKGLTKFPLFMRIF